MNNLQTMSLKEAVNSLKSQDILELTLLLEEYDILGVPGNCQECPIAQLLSRMTNTSVMVDGKQCYNDFTTKDDVHRLPEGVKLFIRGFDQGLFARFSISSPWE